MVGLFLLATNMTEFYDFLANRAYWKRWGIVLCLEGFSIGRPTSVILLRSVPVAKKLRYLGAVLL